MHGNTPHAGLPEDESHAGPPGDAPSSERRRALRRDLVDVATSTRELLSDDFVVGAEIVDEDGLHATVAVQPPAGAVVSAGFETGAGSEADVESLARDLAAGAVLEAKHAIYPSIQSAR